MASTDARPIPKKNVAYRVYFPILDADGDLVTGATGLDSEVSIDGATFADCTNEATEIATSSGMYYLDLTSSEMNGDGICVIVKTSSSGAKTTPITLYPEEAGDIRVDVTMLSGDATAADNSESFFDGTGYAGTNNTIPTVTTVNGLAAGVITATAIATDAIGAAELAADAIAEIADAVWDELESGHVAVGSYGQGLQAARQSTAQAGTVNSITLDASASATDDLYTNHYIFTTGGTGARQCRLITAYVGSTKVASVSPDWAITPSATTIFTILPHGLTMLGPDALNSATLAASAVTEVQTGLATASALTTTDSKIDTIDDFLDTEIAAIKAKTDNLPTDPADESSIQAAIAALNNITVAQILAATVEGSLDVQETLRLLLAVMAGKSSGGGTTSIAFRDTTDSKDRIAATVDGNGNRTAVTLDAS